MPLNALPIMTPALLGFLVSASAAGVTLNDEPVAADVEPGLLTGAPVPSSSIRGRVITQGGSAVPDAMIGVECIREPCTAIPDLGVLSNAEGFFLLPPLPDGLYRLSVLKNEAILGTKVVIVDSSNNATAPVVIKLQSEYQ